jgi:hypothetical protein
MEIAELRHALRVHGSIGGDGRDNQDESQCRLQ